MKDKLVLYEIKPELPSGVELEPDDEVLFIADIPSLLGVVARQAIMLNEKRADGKRVIPFIKFPIFFYGSNKNGKI